MAGRVWGALLAICTLAAVASASNVKGRYFERVIVVPLENQYVSTVLRDPYLKAFSQGSCSRLYGRYYGTTHPSQPNYITMVASDYFGVQTDDNVVINRDCSITDCDPFPTTTIVDLLDNRGISWKAYHEDYPGSLPVSQLKGQVVDAHGCGTGTDLPALQKVGKCYSPGGCFFGSFLDLDNVTYDNRVYARKHMPFLSFDSFVSDERKCSLLQSTPEFWADAESGKLPQYVFYAPNQCNDGHGTHKSCTFDEDYLAGTRNVSAWLKSWLTRLEGTKSWKHTRNLILFVYDENDYDSHHNQVFAMAYGCGVVRPGPRYHCPKSGCPTSASQEAAVKSDCYSAAGVYGAGSDTKCGPTYNAITGAGSVSYKELSSSYSAADGLKADMDIYSHYSIVPLIKNNWYLADLMQGAETARPLRLK